MSIFGKVANGLKDDHRIEVYDTFMDLHHGRWEDKYASQSRAIAAYLQIITGYLDDKNDVECLYISSGVSDPLFRDVAKLLITQAVSESEIQA